MMLVRRTEMKNALAQEIHGVIQLPQRVVVLGTGLQQRQLARGLLAEFIVGKQLLMQFGIKNGENVPVFSSILSGWAGGFVSQKPSN